jgi:epoxyqueuosine reductase
MTSKLTVHGLRRFIEQLVDAERDRQEIGGWWKKPILATGVVDERFEILPRVAFREHLLPRDLLAEARSVIVFFIPFQDTLIKENKKGERPCRNWGVAYVQTNDLIAKVGNALGELLARHGYKSGLTPATHNFDEVRLMARWSHKHLGHLVGLGRFGVHRLLITPMGCAGRLGSLVTEAELGNHPLIEAPEACLLKAGRECGKCVEACPVQALGENDFDRQRCWSRLKDNRSSLDYLSDLPESTHVCGKCAALMPCSFKNPVAELSVPPASAAH